MIQENIKLRLKVNDLMEGLLDDVNRKYDKFVITYKKRSDI